MSTDGVGRASWSCDSSTHRLIDYPPYPPSLHCRRAAIPPTSHQALRKVLAHPNLIYDCIQSQAAAGQAAKRDGVTAADEAWLEATEHFPPGYDGRGCAPEASGKIALLAQLLRVPTPSRLGVLLLCQRPSAVGRWAACVPPLPSAYFGP